ncbi:MAG: flagellar biosynthesis protein FlhB [Clostridia bacterium]|nr:flagellar biosynthesis protein FlhB [Clostridia bacterium]
MSQQSTGEKTEKASAKKKRDARKKGEVHKSHDLNSALTLTIMFGALKIGYDGFSRSMTGFMAAGLSEGIAEKASSLTAVTAVNEYKEILFLVLPVILPLMLTAMVGGVLVNVMQTGPMFNTEKLKPDFKKISPIQGFKRIFSPNTLIDLFKSILKIIILAWIVFKNISGHLKMFKSLVYVSPGRAFSQVMSACFSMGVMIGLALVVFAAIDVLYQWWKYEKDLRMTKQEVKEEYKQLEGDPQLKAKIKQKQRRMSAMRMMSRLREADVVVANPNHLAVALRYNKEEDNAPVVIAKGQDFLAQRIKTRAREYNISIVENKPVARTLYACCNIGDEIPPELYQAIADILIYVYNRQTNGR